MLVKFYSPNCAKFWTFWQKKRVWQRVDGILEDASIAEKKEKRKEKKKKKKKKTEKKKKKEKKRKPFNAKLLISRLPSFSVPKITVVRNV